MWGRLVALIIFTVTCAALVGPLGTVGLGLANTVAMACFAVFLTGLYARRYGFRDGGQVKAWLAVGRQLLAAGVMGVGLVSVRPWLAVVERTSLDGALRLAAVLIPAGVAYVGLVTLLGGRELRLLMSTFKSGGENA